MSEKIIIKYNKKNICRLPIIPDIKVNKVDLIIGDNYIDSEYWKEAKKHNCIKRKIEEGIIEEIYKKEIKIETEEIKKEKIKIEDKFKDIEKEKDNVKKIEDEKERKEKEKKLKEDENKLKKEQEELESKKETIEITDYANLSLKQKEGIINDTFKIDTLTQFLDEEKDSSIRFIIQKKIDEIQNKKTDDTIDHPKSHVKT